MLSLFLFVVVVILLLYFGYLIMKKIDNFAKDIKTEAENDKSYPVAIVFGETELAKQVRLLLEDKGIRIMHLTEPFLVERGQDFVYLFAISENDADNIVLYKIGIKLYGIEKLISICNDRINESMFIKEKIRYLSGNEVTAEKLLEAALLKKEES